MSFAVALVVGVVLGAVLAFAVSRADRSLSRVATRSLSDVQRDRAIKNDERWRMEQAGSPR